MVTFPIEPFLVGSDIAPVREGFDRFVAGLTGWQARAQETGVRVDATRVTQGTQFERQSQHFNSRLIGEPGRRRVDQQDVA